MLHAKITTHEIIQTPLPDGQIHSELGKEIVYNVEGDEKRQRIYVNGKYIKFVHDELCGLAYGVRKTMVKSMYSMEKFFKEFLYDKFWWYGFTISFCKQVVENGKIEK